MLEVLSVPLKRELTTKALVVDASLAFLISPDNVNKLSSDSMIGKGSRTLELLTNK